MGFKRLILLALFTMAVGCGSDHLPTHPIQGQLRFPDGTAPKMGTIELFNAEHKLNARGKIQSDGSFTVGTYEQGDGAVAGKHSVAIIQLMAHSLRAKREVVIEVDESEGDAGHDHDHDQDEEPSDMEMVHPRYADYRTSDLSVEIKPGNNEITLELDHR
ncbi:MAG: hypothetical protein MK108_11210 [Mariniblastus sp.]|nr:hypothetical protein [Mariniblastus sp.]